MLKYQIPNKVIATRWAVFFQNIRTLKEVLRKHSSSIIWTFLLILLYFVLSASLNFYQKWLIKTWGFHYPPGSTICHILAKFLLSALLRWMLIFYNEQNRVELSWRHNVLLISQPGIVAGFYVAFSHLGITLVSVTLYMMAKSLTIVFALGMAFMLKLERKSCTLTGTVLMISGGLAMVTYKGTQFTANGLLLVLLAFFYSAGYLTMAEQIMQDSRFGRCGPIDLLYYMQPWTLLSTSFVALFTFGGNVIYNSMLNTDWTDTYAIVITVTAILGGAVIGFCMELTQLVVISRTSSLTLCIFAACRDLSVLVPASEWRKNEMSDINLMGLLICLAGITFYTVLKLRTIASKSKEVVGKNAESVMEEEITLRY